MNQTLGRLAEQWRTERPDLDLTAIALVTMIKRIADLQEVETREVSTAAMGLGPGDARILLALRRNGEDGPMRPTDLFRSLLITSGAVSKQIDRLEAQGHVERLPDPGYLRGRRIGLTASGRRIADAIMDGLFTAESRLGGALAALPADEREAALATLRTLLDAIEARGVGTPLARD